MLYCHCQHVSAHRSPVLKHNRASHLPQDKKSQEQHYQKQQKSPTITTKQQNPGQQWKVGHFERIQKPYLHKEPDGSQKDICQINHGESGACTPPCPPH